jgi:hypothetical protein
MLKILIFGNDAEGKSTLAALLHTHLAADGLRDPYDFSKSRLIDEPKGNDDAFALLLDPDRFNRNLRSMKGRMAAAGHGYVAIETRNVREPAATPPEPFEIAKVSRWRRQSGPWIETDPRPHIVPTSNDAEAFVYHQLFSPCKEGLFGPFYTGFGVAEIDPARRIRRLAFRFRGDEGLAGALDMVLTAYNEWAPGARERLLDQIDQVTGEVGGYPLGYPLVSETTGLTGLVHAEYNLRQAKAAREQRQSK